MARTARPFPQTLRRKEIAFAVAAAALMSMAVPAWASKDLMIYFDAEDKAHEGAQDAIEAAAAVLLAVCPDQPVVC